MGRDKNKHGLEARVKYPTPTRADAERKGADYAKANRNNSGGDDLQTAVIKMLPTAVAGGRLNADWVELLMGYPMGWTSVEDGSAESTG